MKDEFEKDFLNMFQAGPVPDDDMRSEIDSPVDRYVGNGLEPFYYSVRLNRFCTRSDLNFIIQREMEIARKRGRINFEWKAFAIPKLDFLNSALDDAGFQLDRQCQLMYHKTTFSTSTSPSVMVIEVGSDYDIDILLNISEQAFGKREEWIGKSLRVDLFKNPDIAKAYIAFVDGQPASCGWIKIYSNIAYLFGGGTCPHLRHRGAYKALVDQRCRFAQSRNIKFVMSECSPDSERVLRSLGFSDAGPAWRWAYHFGKMG